jgi:hypothetical protein
VLSGTPTFLEQQFVILPATKARWIAANIAKLLELARKP